MAGRRSKLEMNMDILSAIEKQPKGITAIFYKANLSYYTAREALRYLISIKFVKPIIEGQRTTYFITKIGKDTLKQYKIIQKYDLG